MRRDEAYLLDILIAARKALQFTSGVSKEEFEENEVIQNAVMYSLQIMGEAAARVSKDTRRVHPEINWLQMVGLRNRIVHEYFRIDYGTIWDTIHNDLPHLVELIEPLIPPESEI